MLATTFSLSRVPLCAPAPSSSDGAELVRVGGSVGCAVEVLTEVCNNHLCLFLAIALIAYPGEIHVGVEDYIWGRTGATGTIPEGNGAGRPVPKLFGHHS